MPDSRILILVYKAADGQVLDLVCQQPITTTIQEDGQPWLMLDAATEFERKIEEYYKAFYMGFWELKSGRAVRVFFQPEPKVDLGHSNFFGIFVGLDDHIYICNAKSAFETPMAGIMNPKTAEVIVSQSNHDFRTFKGGGNTHIDGGRVYTRLVGDIHDVNHGLVNMTNSHIPEIDKFPFVDFEWEPQD